MDHFSYLIDRQHQQFWWGVTAGFIGGAFFVGWYLISLAAGGA
jgi:hypothetical protein